MTQKQRLLARLNELAKSIEQTPGGVALLALGSIGRELDRMDDFSDLDFFVIVEPGTKQWFLTHHEWLAAGTPLTYLFRNTIDGFKLVYADGVYGEMAIFEPDELAHIPYSPGRLVYCKPGYSIHEVSALPLPSRESIDVTYQANELMTNLLVGLLRERRGERLAAMMLIQRYAFDRYLAIIRKLVTPQADFVDAYANERRFELHYPHLVDTIAHLQPGYLHNVEAAIAMLQAIQKVVTVEPGIREAIEQQLTIIAQSKIAK